MFRRLLFFLAFFLSFFSLNAAEVNVDVDIYSDYTYFNYKFDFTNDESYRSFSFEKPAGAVVEKIESNAGDVKYSVAGDYLIINPTNVKNKSFSVVLTSEKISYDIYQKSNFELYVNFNFLVDKLNFNIDLIENIGDIESFSPRDYQVLDDGSFLWTVNNLDREELYRLEFSNLRTKDEILNNIFWTDKNIIIVSGVVLLSTLVFLVLMFIFSSRFRLFNVKISFSKNKSKDNKDKKVLVKSEDKKISESNENVETKEKISSDDIEILTETNDNLTVESKINEEEYREVMARFLTDNEKLVVSCIRENEGISQYDILNFLPKLTKSNLSKIISKLDNKKILKRIRVGKVNKIYLGSRFEVKTEEDKSSE